VRVHAQDESAVVEGGTWLEDPSCKKDGRVGLFVPDPIRNHPAEHPDFKALDDAIRLQGNIGTVGKKITATFTGEFTSHSKRPNGVLTLEKVENLDVKIRKARLLKCFYDSACDVCRLARPRNYQFTGKERDSESGLDNFGKARTQVRWIAS
jgi:hypothetical protein